MTHISERFPRPMGLPFSFRAIRADDLSDAVRNDELVARLANLLRRAAFASEATVRDRA